jgi:tRNA(fMet)-specific endonuclease VapC
LALIIADTDVLIDYLKGSRPAADQISSYRRSDNLQTTAITCFELLSGARGSAGDRARRLVETIPVLPLDRESAARAAQVRQDLEGYGFSIGMADSLIAGIALANNLPLLTRNRKHFEKIEGLSLVPMGESAN